MTPAEPQRKRYTVQQKLEIIDFFYENGKNKSLCMRTFGVSRSCITEWIRDEPELRKLSLTQSSRKSLVSRYDPARWPELDARLLQYCKSQTSKRRPITSKLLLRKSIKIAAELKIEEFVGSYGYITNFKNRNNIVTSRVNRAAKDQRPTLDPEAVIRFFSVENRIEIPNQGDEHLQKSIKIANAYMSQSFGPILSFFNVDTETVSCQVSKLEIRQIAHNDEKLWSATDPQSGLDNRKVYIIDYFVRRIEHAGLVEIDIEYRTLVFFQAVCILHEIGNLLNRWSTGMADSFPQPGLAAGSFVERRLFGYRVNLAHLTNENHAAMEALGIVVYEETTAVRVSSNWIDWLYGHIINGNQMPHPFTICLFLLDFDAPLDSKNPNIRIKGVYQSSEKQSVQQLTQ